jgi:hypothetical protein
VFIGQIIFFLGRKGNESFVRHLLNFRDKLVVDGQRSLKHLEKCKQKWDISRKVDCGWSGMVMKKKRELSLSKVNNPSSTQSLNINDEAEFVNTGASSNTSPFKFDNLNASFHLQSLPN